MQVPIYQNNTPNPQSEQSFARPGENVQPTFDYARAMERATQPLKAGIGLSVKFAEKAEAQQVKAEADEALNGLDQELRELQWNPESGYYAMKGKTAVEGYDPTREAMNKAYQTRLDKLQNPLAKQAFTSVALEKINSYDQSMQRYRLKENAAYKAEVSDTRAKSLIDDFAFSGFGPDSERTMASLMDEVDYQGKIGGKSPEWIARQKDNYAALAYASAYQQMAVEDPYGALKHFQQVGSTKMSPDVSRKTYALLRERVWPQLQETVDAMGGPEAIGLTQGSAARAAGKVDVRVSGAQAGLGTPPSVPDKVLNTIGYKFCNPLNIKVFGNNWSGMVGQDARGHAIFETPQDGICAAAKILKTYASKYGINTVDGIVDRFCAASDGVTRAYISNVCKAMGVNPGEALDVKNPQVMTKLISAMMRQEIGAVAYSQETITAGVHKALGIDKNDYSDKFNTQLTEDEEKQYQAWAKKIGHERDVYDYDLRGAWKAGAAQAENGHFPDTFKKPNHPTFSVESKYHDGKNYVGGHWVVENGQNIFIGPHGERRDDNGKLLSQKAEAPRLTSKDVAFNPNVKTGDPVIDALPLPDKIKLFRASRQRRGQQAQQAKVELKRSVDNVLSRAINTGDVAELPDVADFISVYGQDEGIRMHAEVEKQAQLNAAIHSMPAMSVGDMDATSRALTPQKDDPEYATRMEQKTTWDKAAEKVKTERAKDPMRFAIEGIPELGFKPIQDWSNQTLAIRELTNRISSYKDVARRFGTDAHILTKTEATGLCQAFANMDEDHQAEYAQKLSDAIFDPVTGDSGALAALATDIGKNHHLLAIALGVASTSQGRENNGALRQIKGNYYRRNKVNDANKDEPEIRQNLDGVLPIPPGSPEYEDLINAVLNDHAYALQAGGSSDVDTSIENVIGPVTEHNGAKIILPSRLSQASKNLMTFTKLGSFEDVLLDYSKDFLKGGKKLVYRNQVISPEQSARLINTAPLKWVGDGVYFIRDGLRYVTDEKGEPFRLDLNDTISRRIK